MGNETLSRRLGGTMAIATLVVAVAIPLTAVGKADKITICHGAGQAGTDQFVTLELAPQAVYGNGGHFTENGTPRAGHETDHLGPCLDGLTTTTEDTDTTLGSEPGSTGTTVPEETTSTENEVEVAPMAETTSTTAPPETPTTALPHSPEVAAVGSQADGGGDAQAEVGAAGEFAPGSADSGDDVDAATLPFTGVDQSLILPASLMLLAGAIFIYLTGDLIEASGAHVAVDAESFGLGLHRGRHESV